MMIFSLEIPTSCLDKEEKKRGKAEWTESGSWLQSEVHTQFLCFGLLHGSQGTCCHHSDNFHNITKNSHQSGNKQVDRNGSPQSRKKRFSDPHY